MGRNDFLQFPGGRCMKKSKSDEGTKRYLYWSSSRESRTSQSSSSQRSGAKISEKRLPRAAIPVDGKNDEFISVAHLLGRQELVEQTIFFSRINHPLPPQIASSQNASDPETSTDNSVNEKNGQIKHQVLHGSAHSTDQTFLITRRKSLPRTIKRSSVSTSTTSGKENSRSVTTESDNSLVDNIEENELVSISSDRGSLYSEGNDKDKKQSTKYDEGSRENVIEAKKYEELKISDVDKSQIQNLYGLHVLETNEENQPTVVEEQNVVLNVRLQPIPISKTPLPRPGTPYSSLHVKKNWFTKEELGGEQIEQDINKNSVPVIRPENLMTPVDLDKNQQPIIMKGCCRNCVPKPEIAKRQNSTVGTQVDFSDPNQGCCPKAFHRLWRCCQ